MSFIKFSKIGAFHNAVKYARKHAKLFNGPVSFTGSVKIHGTNAGIVVLPDGKCLAQSRNRTLSLEDDNCGFARWALQDEVCQVMREFAEAVWKKDGERPVVIYGEWCGPGIQRGVAVNELPEKQFVMFAAGAQDDEGERLYIDDAPLLEMISPKLGLRSILEGPRWTVECDLLDAASSSFAANQINEFTEEVSKKCPWGSLHGIEGVGEGIVWRPTSPKFYQDSDLFFKSKCEDKLSGLHAKKAKTSAPASPDVLAFVEEQVHQERLKQGLDYILENYKVLSMQYTGDFLKWVNQDVQDECKDELEASNLTWKDVSRHVNQKAMTFWRREVSKI